MSDVRRKCETASRLMRYSAAAGLGAFAFGQTAAEGAIVHTDLGGIVISRGESATFDVDGDGYADFRLANTDMSGVGGIGTVQLNSTAHPGWYGAPGTNIDYPNAGASYVQVNMDAPSTNGTNAYYVRSFIDNDVIGPSNPKSVDETPNGGGGLYGLLSQYPGWDKNSFWNPSLNPGTYGYSYSEYAGLRMVDTNGDTRYAWVRFQVTLHDVGDTYGFPFPDGELTRHDLIWDTERTVTLLDFAFEMAPDTDIIAGMVPEPGCLGLLATGAGALSLRRRFA